MTLELDTIGSGHSTSKINTNFQKIEDSINDDVLKREIEVGDANEMRTHLDMNQNPVVNASTDVEDPSSLLTVGDADARYYNIEGDTLEGDLNAGGNKITGVPNPEDTNDATNKGFVDAEVSSVRSEAQTLYVKLAGDTMQNPLAGPDSIQASHYMPQLQVTEAIDARMISAPDFDPENFQDYGLVTEAVTDTNDYGAL